MVCSRPHPGPQQHFGVIFGEPPRGDGGGLRPWPGRAAAGRVSGQTAAAVREGPPARPRVFRALEAAGCIALGRGMLVSPPVPGGLGTERWPERLNLLPGAVPA